jgi:mannose-6-phosphate isomerase-like protein (cupin superfamily)
VVSCGGGAGQRPGCPNEFGESEYHWHKHTSEDELFYVYKGKIAIQLKGQVDIVLHEGEMVVIPKGMEHCPKSMEPL